MWSSWRVTPLRRSSRWTVGQWGSGRLAAGGGAAAGLERRVVHVVGQRPGEAGPAGAGEVVAHRRGGQARGGRHLAAAEALAQGEAEDLADLAHGGTGAWHRRRSSNGWVVRGTMADPGALTSPLVGPRL